jgi:methionyl-tRNA formyltransferase
VLRILYAGSPEAAAKTLELLVSGAGTKYEIAGVLTNPPSAQGRHKDLIPTPVASCAEINKIPVFCPEHLDGACREQIAPVHPDLLVCFAYGRIFGPKFMALFRYGGINLHPSLLPKYRGCTPVNQAILDREGETGITVQKLAQGMDEGDILAQETVRLDGTETAGSLLMYSAEHGAALLRSVIEQTAQNGSLPEGKTQTGTPSYTSIITKENGKIDWTRSAPEIDAQIRAYTPEPACWTMENGAPLRILAAHPSADSGIIAAGSEKKCAGTVIGFDKKQGILIQTGDGILAVTMLQRQGKKAMDAVSFMNGARDFAGTVLA